MKKKLTMKEARQQDADGRKYGFQSAIDLIKWLFEGRVVRTINHEPPDITGNIDVGGGGTVPVDAEIPVRTLLWENPDPEAEYSSSATLPMPWEDYDLIEIVMGQAATIESDHNKEARESVFFDRDAIVRKRDGNYTRASMTVHRLYYSGNEYTWHHYLRNLWFFANGGVQFSAVVFRDGSYSDGYKGHCIPVAVYGLNNAVPAVRGERGETGEDGFSPIVTVTQTATGAHISVTDAQGTTGADVDTADVDWMTNEEIQTVFTNADLTE